jgi:hypothetical protein
LLATTVLSRVQHKARRFHLCANNRRLYPMQRPRVTCARPSGCNVVNDDVKPTGLESFIDSSIETRRGCPSALEKGGMEIVIEQMQPHDIRRVRGVRQRYEVR